MIPNDPMMLLSYVNTRLRDVYPDFETFCGEEGVDLDAVTEKLRSIDYEYDSKLNRFV